MPTAPISVDSDTFVTAAEGFFEVDGLVCDIVAAAAVGAAWGDAMAGCDSSGAAWARDYDAAARAALQAGAALADTLGHVGTLLSTSGDSHAGAEASSVPGGPPSYPGSGGGPGASSVIPSTPPSADGTPGDPPPGWFLVAHLLTATWPNGHQDQLRAVGGTWATAGAALSDAADRLSGPIGDLSALTSDEVDAAVTTCCDVQRSMRELSNACSTLGFACRDYADHLDTAHTTVVVELVELVAEAALIEAVGAFTAVPSAGSSEVGAQEVVAARAALSATRIAATLARLEELVNALATIAREAITGIAGVVATNAAVQALGWGSAVAQVVPASALPPLSFPGRTIENKFKHADAFGVTVPRGRAGFDAFRAALLDFVARPGTMRTPGFYRRQPVILNYDPVSRLVVIQTTDGDFVSGWKMSDAQLKNVMERRSIGGG